MSLSIPTIVSDIPGSRDLILPGQTCLLAPAQDAKALSEAIRWMPRIPRSGEPWGDRGVSASLETLVLRLTRGFSLVFSARSPRHRISVRMAPNFRAHGNLFLCARKFPAFPQCSDALLAGGDCCIESYPLFRELRHRTLSSPICLSEEIHKPFALSRIFLLSSEGKSVLLMKKKASSRSGFLLSTHVVLKTRHVSPNIHVRRY